MDRAAQGNAAGATDEVREELEYDLRPGSIEAALDALRWNLGEAYEVGTDDEGRWWFRRLDGGGREYAELPGPQELHRMIVEDYTLRPVRRDAGA